MKTITGPWSYVTPTVTIDYGEGKHKVADEIADAWAARVIASEEKGADDGDGIAALDAPGTADAAQV